MVMPSGLWVLNVGGFFQSACGVMFVSVACAFVIS